MNFVRAQPHFAATIGLIGAGSLYFWWKWYTKKEPIPTVWREVGKLNDLMCFPIKSCGIIRAPSMECTEIGLKSGCIDREFMVVNENGHFITARVQPRLLLIDLSISDNKLTLSAPGVESFTLDLNIKAPASKIDLWGANFKGIDCGDDVAKWFSRFILNEDNGIRLARFPPNSNNMKRSRLRGIIRDDDSGAYSDLTSYCIINESSIDDLNSRLKDVVVDAQTFRPNFVVKGPQPLEEDHWEWVKIGDVVFRVVKFCTRCVLTTIDRRTAIRNPNGEPLTTLRTYRMIGVKKNDKDSPVMGQHLAIRQAGTVNMGDTVYVA